MAADHSAGGSEHPNTKKLLDSITKWIKQNLSSEEYMEFKRRQIGHTLAEEWERRLGIIEPDSEEFVFPDEIGKQHAVIVSFFNLYQAQIMLSQCEYYFRRFPFRGFPVTLDDHARNVCEFYFGCFYIIRSRFKDTLNKLKAACPGIMIEIGKSLDSFDKAFDQELRARNSVHHREPFGDLDLERMSLSRILASGRGMRGKDWEREHRATYRKFAREWSHRARDRGRVMATVIDTVAAAILGAATFLRFP